MTLKPEEFSSFCFLDREDFSQMNMLIENIDSIYSAFTDDLKTGFAAAYTIKHHVIAAPQRNPFESSRVHEAAINQSVKEYFKRSDAYMLKKWDTCSSAMDCMLDLIAKQDEVKTFLATMEEKKPKAEAKHILKFIAAMPESRRDALDELHDRMKAFTEIPLLKIYNTEAQMLATLCTNIQNLTHDYSAFAANAADKLGEEVGNRAFKEFTKREQSVGDRLDQVRSILEISVDRVPYFSEMQDAYLQSPGTSRQQG